mmetsp:Transcript_20736/g.37438  ORF Transcript_20736/g.37438 Transcript_20736/m.37438 type:complete len:574 (+) Transcript_20736:137-1858(+)
MSAHFSLPDKDKNKHRMMLSPALVLAALVQHAAFTPTGALAPSLHHFHHRTRFSSALSYSSGENDGEPVFSPELQRQVDQSTEARPPRHIPRRAMPHVQNASHTEAAIRAGYIIRNREAMQPETGANDSMKNSQELQPQRQMERGVRPLRSIRRIVHRSRQEQPSQGLQQEEQNQIRIQAPDTSLDVHIRNRPNNRRSMLSRHPQLDEFLDKPEQLPPNEEARKGARRVTFKATREASKSIISKPVATLAEYMTQPVSQYSLFSFHDAEGSNNGNSRKNENTNQSMSRRWLVRRLTTKEARRYIDHESSEEDGVMDESNLFRLAVPLLPLIGWDLTPVIDLEVIPPKSNNEAESNRNERVSIDDNAMSVNRETADQESTSSSKWEPLRGIRERIRGDDANNSDVGDHPPVVKIRSLRVSLLSTQEEVKEVMSNNSGRSNQRRGSDMQKEAIEMVGKVEEWLRPHISFEAELSWNDGLSNSGVVAETDPSSTVTVKSTAITSLTIPKIPSDILRATVPSAFFVKRLGATLTSQALAVCLPRFLRQLEKDYIRWSGLGLSADSVVENGDISRNID